MNHFSELSLSTLLENNLAANCFSLPTPVQAQSIPPALEGRDIVATAQTGTGKTLAFVLPMLERLLAGNKSPAKGSGARALILSPTRELAIQIHETFVKLAAGSGIKAAIVVGGLSETNQLREIRQGAQVLIATPGRLEDFLSRKLVKLAQVEVFVLDEADRMLDMGFLPAIQRISRALPKERQTMLFSATIETSVAHLISEQVRKPVRIEIGTTTKPTDQVDLFRYEVERDRKLPLLIHLTAENEGSFLVFVGMKHGADRLAKKLSSAGVKAGQIHGGRTQSQRNQALDAFKNGKYRVLVATDVAARGIHVDGIAHVVNYDLPKLPEDFVHRIGRTGRAGARGVASTFHTRVERSEIKRIERALNAALVQRHLPEDLEREAIGRVSDTSGIRLADNGLHLVGESISGRNHTGTRVVTETESARQENGTPNKRRRARGPMKKSSFAESAKPEKRTQSSSENTSAKGKPSRNKNSQPRQQTAKQLVDADVERGSRKARGRFDSEAAADRLSDMWTAGEFPQQNDRGAYRKRSTSSGGESSQKSRPSSGRQSGNRSRRNSSRGSARGNASA